MAGQFQFAREALASLRPLLAGDAHVLLTHGNGPQVGHILTRVEAALGKSYAIPLEVCVAESEGELGYVLDQTLHNLLVEWDQPRPIAGLLTQVIVDEHDPAFARPSKPIGPFYNAAQAVQLAQKGFSVVDDAGRGFRRVVPSPEPKEIVDAQVIDNLLQLGVFVIAAGGGGIPVVRNGGRLAGVEAVVDKDLTSALLGELLDAALMVILTGVPCAYRNFGRRDQQPIGRITIDQAQRLIGEGHFAPGSMLPKMEAAVRFARRWALGRSSAIRKRCRQCSRVRREQSSNACRTGLECAVSRCRRGANGSMTNTKWSCLIMGAAGRDFHDFQTFFRRHPEFHVCAFTAAQIPFIEMRTFPKSLAGPDYSADIPIFPEAKLADLIETYEIDFVFLAYSDLRHVDVMHIASRIQALGASFVLLGPRHTQLISHKPVISVTAVRTGAGKSPLAQFLAYHLKRGGRRVGIIRHPMPYGNLARQRVERIASHDDLDRFGCTIEEREEYVPYLEQGLIVYAGVDYESILREAETEADVILWDGGNNDFPFIRPGLSIVVADALRPGHEIEYYPGETNLLAADVVVINKVGQAQPEQISLIREHVERNNPSRRGHRK